MWPFRRRPPVEEKPAADASQIIENPEIPGRGEVVQWFGSWPSFHDAEILEVHLDRSGPSWIKLHTWLMTNRVDLTGRYVLEKHAVVTFTFEGILDLQLADFNPQNVISGLDLTRRENRLRIDLHPCYGVSGYIEATTITVSVSPGMAAPPWHPARPSDPPMSS